jgi:hypothetical protein
MTKIDPAMRAGKFAGEDYTAFMDRRFASSKTDSEVRHLKAVGRLTAAQRISFLGVSFSNKG